MMGRGDKIDRRTQRQPSPKGWKIMLALRCIFMSLLSLYIVLAVFHASSTITTTITGDRRQNETKAFSSTNNLFDQRPTQQLHLQLQQHPMLKDFTTATTTSRRPTTIATGDHNKGSVAACKNGTCGDQLQNQQERQQEHRQGPSSSLLLQTKLTKNNLDMLYKNSTFKLWELSDYTPRYMKQYFIWHSNVRQNQFTYESLMTSNNNNPQQQQQQNDHNIKLLIIQLYDDNGDDSGSDPMSNHRVLVQQLSSLPIWIHMAYTMNRLLLIDWNLSMLPSSEVSFTVQLTDFLLPPIGGVDWRVPKWLTDAVLNDPSNGPRVQNVRSNLHNISSTVDEASLIVRVVIDSANTNDVFDNDQRLLPSFHLINKDDEADISFANLYHDLWRILFTPVDIVRKATISKRRRPNRGMYPGTYLSIYQPSITIHNMPSTDKSSFHLMNETLKCASAVQPTKQIFYPYDNPRDSEGDGESFATAIKALGRAQEVKIFTMNTEENAEKPLKGLQATTMKPIHDSLTILYLMGMGGCILTYNNNPKGGLDYLSSLIGYNRSCYFSASDYCSSTNMSQMDVIPTKTNRSSQLGHEFVDPMPDEGSDFSSLVRYQAKSRMKDLPRWMGKYFAWHNRTKSNLSPNNWKSTKYLIMVCWKTHSNCGGISDRLKPLPMIVLEAYRNDRLLLIWWERPKPLEEFLVPPVDGIDWTVPAWLKDELKRDLGPKASGSVVSGFEQAKVLLKGGHEKLAVAFKIQSPSSGENLYPEEQSNDPKLFGNGGGGGSSSTYKDVFHQLFRKFFQPGNRLQAAIDKHMSEQKLVPGQYSAVHLRAMYGNREYRDPNEMVELAVLGVNCASNLLPGAPIYFASDTTSAVDAAVDYARMHNLPVASLQNSGQTMDEDVSTMAADPIHLDKDDEWESRDASAYDSTFIDLYMLAQSRCVSYSNGGYGTFGSLLSYDADCQMRFFKQNKKIKRCRWMSADRTRHDLTLPNATIPLLDDRKGR